MYFFFLMVFAVVVAKATKHEVECHIPNQIFFFPFDNNYSK